jgi:protein SCO1
MTGGTNMSGSTSSPAPRRPVRVRWPIFAAVFAVTCAVTVLAGLRPGSDGAHAFHGTAYPEPEAAPAFALTDHQGRQVGLEDFRGGPVLLFFGFTHCPDVCPLTLTRLSRAVDALGQRAEDTRILLVTVDPERDTPEVLAEYVRQFGPKVTGLTGDAEILERMRREYGVYAAMHAGHDAGEPMVMHTDAVFGIDRKGRLRVLLHADGPEVQLEEDIRTLTGL